MTAERVAEARESNQNDFDPIDMRRLPDADSKAAHDPIPAVPAMSPPS